MIPDEQFEIDHQNKILDQYPSINQPLLEKTLYAFELLGQLLQKDLSFVFKGGTSLLLLLPELRRLSIDIDVIGQISEEPLEDVAEGSRFLRKEPIELPNTEDLDIPLKRYYFYYDSKWLDREEYIQLDILEDEHVYPEVKEIPVETDFFEYEDDLKVMVPTTKSILGDKLAAFAPDTIGISYDSESIRIAKQMYDVATLVDFVNEYQIVEVSYREIHKRECSYKNESFSVEECLKDTLHACFLLSHYQLPNAPKDSTNFDVLTEGIDRLENYLVTGGYSQRQSVLHASQAGLMAAGLLGSKAVNDLSFNEPVEGDKLENAEIKGKYAPLNHLKKTNIDAFANWWKISQWIESLK